MVPETYRNWYLMWSDFVMVYFIIVGRFCWFKIWKAI